MEKQELEELKLTYKRIMKSSSENIERFKGKPGEQEWLIRFYMARGKVELLEYLIKKIE